MLIRRGYWRLVRCDVCGLVYLPEIPTDQAMDTEFEWSKSFDRERAERERKHRRLRQGTRLVSRLRPRREVRALRRIQRAAPPGRMLDVGCGDGRLDAEALRAGYDVTGVELSPVMADKARGRIGPDRVLCGRLRDFNLDAGSFDIVVTVSYLEHEPNPGELARAAFELLRPGGVFINKVPNYASWLRTLLGERWSGYRFPEHMQYFTPETLARLLQTAGFRVDKTWANPLGDNFWLASRK